VVIAEWKQQEAHRRDMNSVITHELLEEAVQLWEAEHNCTKAKKWKPGWQKPVLKPALIPPIPKPPKLGAEDDGSEEESDSGSEDK